MKTGDANEVYSIVQSLKKKFPKSKHIAGGTHIDMLPDECAEKFDTIIIGPAEKNFKISLESNNKILKEDYTNIPFLKHLIQEEIFYPSNQYLAKKCLNNTGNIMQLWFIFQEDVFINAHIVFIMFQINYNLKVQS